MENIKLFVVGEQVEIRETGEKCFIKRVKYDDSCGSRTIDVNTTKGMYKMHELKEIS
jgi:hypothetical protein